ncbi:hypothetical protein [Streptomyces atratus]|uniref:hypothetical protein n=1 Tax=Streptomyces atratus TaxID=1893 RepID=UPI0033E38043
MRVPESDGALTERLIGESPHWIGVIGTASGTMVTVKLSALSQRWRLGQELPERADHVATLNLDHGVWHLAPADSYGYAFGLASVVERRFEALAEATQITRSQAHTHARLLRERADELAAHAPGPVGKRLHANAKRLRATADAHDAAAHPAEVLT